jgi:hypothetical protein
LARGGKEEVQDASWPGGADNPNDYPDHKGKERHHCGDGKSYSQTAAKEFAHRKGWVAERRAELAMEGVPKPATEACWPRFIEPEGLANGLVAFSGSFRSDYQPGRIARKGCEDQRDGHGHPEDRGDHGRQPGAKEAEHRSGGQSPATPAPTFPLIAA